ncbi:hypothetical protein IFT68_00750 [Oxalobacteraceae sp. CFBP 13730]|nr:hypothetical protein [Oxalobacteraceae sp. CFBP 13730]
MSISTTPPSPYELYAGILAVADYIGPSCKYQARSAMQDWAARAPQTEPLAAELTLRDRFAIAALPAVVSSVFADEVDARDGPITEKTIAQQAYHFADAMLAARGAA